MRVEISATAEAELEQIGDYIAKDSPLRAVSFIDELIDAAQSIGVNPEAYRLIPRYEHFGYRRRPFGAYLIIYTIRMDHIIIAHILHSAQDY